MRGNQEREGRLFDLCDLKSFLPRFYITRGLNKTSFAWFLVSLETTVTLYFKSPAEEEVSQSLTCPAWKIVSQGAHGPWLSQGVSQHSKVLGTLHCWCCSAGAWACLLGNSTKPCPLHLKVWFVLAVKGQPLLVAEKGCRWSSITLILLVSKWRKENQQ